MSLEEKVQKVIYMYAPGVSTPYVTGMLRALTRYKEGNREYGLTEDAIFSKYCSQYWTLEHVLGEYMLLANPKLLGK